MDRVLPHIKVHHHVYTYSITNIACILCLEDEPQAAERGPTDSEGWDVYRARLSFGGGWPVFAEDASPRGLCGPFPRIMSCFPRQFHP